MSLWGRGSAVVVSLLVAVIPATGAVHANEARRGAPLPVVSKVAPDSSSPAGGVTVTIKGKKLTGAKKVMFGTAEGSHLKVKNAHKLTVVAPAHAAGLVDVRVVTKGGKSKRSPSDHFTYTSPPPPPAPAAPVVIAALPSSGPTAGGTFVTVTGTGFSGVTGVTFGGVAGTAVNVVSTTQLSVVSPAHGAGVVHLIVTASSGSSAATPADHFTYQTPPRAPTVTGVSPGSGPTAGGTSVTVTGTGFSGVTGVTFGGVAGTAVNVVSTTQLSVVSPAHGAGVVHLIVTASSGSSAATPADHFTYQTPPRAPTVTGVSPGSGPTAGGTSVTVTGTGFSGVTGVTFGGAAGTAVNVVSTTQLSVVSPPHATGAVDVVVTNGLGASAVVPSDQFAYSDAAGPTGVTAPLPPDSATDQSAGMSDVDCPAPGTCVAVGSYRTLDNDQVPLLEHLAGGVWTPVRGPLPSGGQVPANALIEAISCASATFCVAVGNYVNDASVTLPLVETWNGNSWTANSPGLPAGGSDARLVSVSCADATLCVAAGGFDHGSGTFQPLTVTWQGGVWGSTLAPLPVGAVGGEASDVDCPASNVCVVVGTYQPSGLDSLGFADRLASGSWSTTSLPVPADARALPGVAVKAVSCATGFDCVAVGSYAKNDNQATPGLIERLNSGTWSAVGISAPDALQRHTGLADISCTSTNHCLVGGGYRVSQASGGSLLVTIDGASAVLAEVSGIPNTESARIAGVACTGTVSCGGVGFYGGGAFTATGIMAQELNGTASFQVAPVPASATSWNLTRVAANGANGIAVGNYISGGDTSEGLIVMGVPFK